MAKRRPSGDGMVRKRADGRWEGRIVVGHKQNGDPIFRYVLAATQKELLDKLHQSIEAYRDVELTEDSRMTLSEWLDRWLDEIMAGAIRPGTLKGYRRYADLYLKPILGHKQVAQITPADVEKLYRHLKKHGRVHPHPQYGEQLSDSMVHSIHTMFHGAMKAAEQARLTARNPTEGVAVPRPGRSTKQVLNDKQVEQFLDELKKDPVWYDFFYTELTTGLRRGEICGLQWQDFDAEKGVLKIARTLHYRRRGEYTTGETKTGQSARTILLPKSTADILRNRKSAALSEWIFPDPLRPDLPTAPQAAYNHMKALLERAGLPSIRFHDLRHTFATRALAGGVDPKTLSDILGHTKASFTLDTYTHVTGDMQQRAADMIGDFMTELFGEELKPWQSAENQARAAST